MRKIFNTSDEKGQSVIEFLLVFIFCLSFLSMSVTVGINYVAGYLVHYQVFEASRIYQVYDNGSREVSTALNEARSQTQAFFSEKQRLRRALGIKGDEIMFNTPEQTAIYEFVGIYYPYDLVLRGIGNLLGEKLSLVSESFLGKDPVRADCQCRTLYFLTGDTSCNISSLIDQEVTIYDNGC